MKKLVFLLFLTFSFYSPALQAQYSFSLTELENMMGYYAAPFDNYVVAKDYSYQDGLSNTTTMVYNSNEERTFGPDKIVRYTDGKNLFIAIGTTDLPYYLSIRNELNRRYKFVKEDNPNAASTQLTFTNGTYNVIAIVEKTNYSGMNILKYYVQISSAH